MRSLFFRIFFSFWLAMTLIGTILVIIAVNTDHKQAIVGRHEEPLRTEGERLLTIWRQQGPAALAQAENDRERTTGNPAWLLDQDGRALSGRHLPERAGHLARRAADASELDIRPTPRGTWVAIPLDEAAVLLARIPPPTRLERIFNPSQLGIRLAVTFIIAGLVCFFLARSLAAPLRDLRHATRRLADGDLASRVDERQLGSRRDETAELARDFNRMAERIDGLVQAQRRLLVDISHELRSPLTRLQLALELARRQDGPEQAGNLDRIGREAERLNDLIGQLRTLTLLESGEAPLQKETLRFEKLLAEIVQDANFEASQRGCEVRLATGEPVELTGAPELLRRAVENVVRNALRYTPAGSKVELELGRDDGSAVIQVRDYGPGIPDSALPHIFEPFYRVEAARDRESGGLGLGLAIAARAVHLHGGSIRAVNPSGGGLLISIRLPAQAT